MQKEIWEFIKINLKWLLVVVAILILYFKGCFKQFEPKAPIIQYDTTRTQQPQPIIIVPPYQPQQGTTTYPIVLPQQAQGVIPASSVEELVKQVQLLNDKVNILGKELYATRNYNDSLTLRDSSGQRVGVVNSNYTVTENDLKKIAHNYQLSPIQTTITKTITQPYKERNQVYLQGGGSSFSTSFFNQADVGLLFKNKRGMIIGGSYAYNFQAKSSGFRISAAKLIQFRKR